MKILFFFSPSQLSMLNSWFSELHQFPEKVKSQSWHFDSPSRVNSVGVPDGQFFTSKVLPENIQGLYRVWKTFYSQLLKLSPILNEFIDCVKTCSEQVIWWYWDFFGPISVITNIITDKLSGSIKNLCIWYIW